MEIQILPSIQTFVALLFAHLIADFLFQTNHLVQHKNRPFWFGFHITIVALVTFLIIGGDWLVTLAIAVSHLVLDASKEFSVRKFKLPERPAFYLDQLAHICVIALVAFFAPFSFATSWWAEIENVMIQIYIVGAGGLICVAVGGHIVGFLLQPFNDHAAEFSSSGMPNGGKLIGHLERLSIFILFAIGQPAGVAFLIAAKSFLRFEEAKKQVASEYVIVGTLASFCWAIVYSTITFKFVQL